MTKSQSIREDLGWSREKLAQESGVEVASIYLLERLGTAGPDDDVKITDTLNKYQAQRLAPGGPDYMPVRENKAENQTPNSQIPQIVSESGSETRLEMVRRHLEQGGGHVSSQRALVARLRHGEPVT